MPSAKVLESKQAIVADLTDKLKGAASGVVVSYGGITVEDDTKLRADLRKAGVEYKVLKNTMILKACQNVGYEALGDTLNGMTAIAISKDDPIAPAKILKGYADKIESFELKGGFCDGQVMDKAGITALADTPSKEVLIGRMLGSLQGPISSLAVALQAIIDKQGEAPAAPAEA